MGNFLFRFRNLTPVPFFILLLFFSKPNIFSFFLSLPFILAGELLRIESVKYSGPTTRSKTINAPYLAKAGPYSFVRNPIYLGNFLIGLGATIALSPSPLFYILYTVLFFFQYTLIVFSEENFLEKKFGEEYISYKKNVPRFIPKIRAFSSNLEKTTYNYKQVLRQERGTLLGIFIFIIFILIWILIK